MSDIVERLRHPWAIDTDDGAFEYIPIRIGTEAAAEIERLREEVSILDHRRGGECDTCGKWVCPPLRCVGCMMRSPLAPNASIDGIASSALAEQDKQITTLRARVAELEKDRDSWRREALAARPFISMGRIEAWQPDEFHPGIPAHIEYKSARAANGEVGQ